ncbi:MAG: hypothetical protein R2873_08280 [Caldilineaceae bacterium]
MLLLIIWTAATVNFLIPKMTPRNPLREKLLEQASRSGYIEEGFDEMVAAYEARFGLDQPLWRHIINYMSDMATPGFGLLHFKLSKDGMGDHPRSNTLDGGAIAYFAADRIQCR